MHIKVKDKQPASLEQLRGTLHGDLDARNMAKIFPKMRHDFDAIKSTREFYEHYGINASLARKGKGIGRRIASIPRPVFVWLTQVAPEILSNPQLLRTFLREHPEYLLVDKSRI